MVNEENYRQVSVCRGWDTYYTFMHLTLHVRVLYVDFIGPLYTWTVVIKGSIQVRKDEGGGQGTLQNIYDRKLTGLN